MIAFVDREWSGEIANRLRGVGRYHASRLIVLAYEPRRERLDARVMIASEGDRAHRASSALLRETVVVELGDRHLDDLLTIADPLVVTDLPTLLWSPHGHHEIVAELLGARAGGAARLGRRADRRARRSIAPCELSRAGLRRRPRLAALDAVARAGRGDLRPAVAAPRAARDHGGDGPPPPRLDRRRRCCSSAGSPRAWTGEPSALVADGGALVGHARTARAASDVALRLQAAPELQVPGLEGADAGDGLGPAPATSTAGRGGLRARIARRQRRGARMDAPRAPRAARPACSARASARRCCATPPTLPALDAARGDWLAHDAADRRCPTPRRVARARRAHIARELRAGARASAASRTSRSAAARRPGRTYELLGAMPSRAGRCRGVVRRRALRRPRGRGEQLPARRRDAARPRGDRRRARPPHARASSARTRARAATPQELVARAGAGASAGGAAGARRRSCSGIGPDGHVASLFPGAATLDAGDAGDLPRRRGLAEAAAAADHAEPRGAARRARLPAARDRREQGRRGQRDARRAQPARAREPARRERLTVIADDAAAPDGRRAMSERRRRPARSVLVRHAETEWSVSGRHTGRTDIPLTEHGRDAAPRAAPSACRRGSSQLVLVQPARCARAKRASCAGWAREAQVRDDLLEWDYGDYEGLTTRADPRRSARTGTCGATAAPAARAPPTSARAPTA